MRGTAQLAAVTSSSSSGEPNDPRAAHGDAGRIYMDQRAAREAMRHAACHKATAEIRPVKVTSVVTIRIDTYHLGYNFRQVSYEMLHSSLICA